MRTVVNDEDTESFAARVGPVLLEREAENNLLFGVLADIRAGRYATYELLSVCQEDVVVGAALMTPPHNLLLSTMSPELSPVLADALHERGIAVPGVAAADDQAETFARAWCALTGMRAKLEVRHGIYRLRSVRPPDRVGGRLRPATDDDLPLLTTWLQAFSADAHLPRQDETAARRTALAYHESTDRGLWIWDDDGPVSMAAHSGPTPSGIRIGAVYTPRELRRRGYASACVAAVSAEMLARGRTFCFLFTDLSNPTSNKIYAQIGYERVGESTLLTFE